MNGVLGGWGWEEILEGWKKGCVVIGKKVYGVGGGGEGWWGGLGVGGGGGMIF